jgi:hypothetical protein
VPGCHVLIMGVENKCQDVEDGYWDVVWMILGVMRC